MFEAAELGRKVSKADYEAQLPSLRSRLLEAQMRLREAGIGAVVVISGADGAGKSETVNRLHEWLDPRGLETHAFGPPSDEESERPDYWRFWRTMPARGRIGLFIGSWYTSPVIRRAYRELSRAEFDQTLDRIAFFERMLVADGLLIVKFWLHLSKRDQRRQLETLSKSKKTRWRVTPLDWKHLGLFEKFVPASEQAIRQTDSAAAPWTIVEAHDARFRELAVGQALLQAFERGLAATPARVSVAAPAIPAPAAAPAVPDASVTVLDKVDLSLHLTPEEYERKLDKAQARLGRIVRAAWEKKVSTVAVFEGWDAAGKGGNIRRLTAAMDARICRVIPVAAPTDEERAHHYLWRFWRHLPRAGRVTIYDRSWYGRVLVERVEGFAADAEWSRAYEEINDFEQQLAEHGIVLAKFWIHIGKDEQIRRFKEREETAYKRHKITAEDWRNREKWDAYRAAVSDMVVHTSTQAAPWTLVAGNDKRYARVQTIQTLCETLERAI
jgi:AMP-polyphosphate phosphotransferase